MRSPHTRNEESALLTTVRDSLCAAVSPVQPEINKKIIKKKNKTTKTPSETSLVLDTG